MATIRTSADSISLLENDEGFRRDVAQWLLANQSVLAEWDAPAAAIAPSHRVLHQRHGDFLRIISHLLPPCPAPPATCAMIRAAGHPSTARQSPAL